MISNTAWQRHGCYTLGSDQYFNMPLGRAALGCQDDWNSLDHFDPTADSRRIFSHFNSLRTQYNVLQDGFNLVQRGNWTSFIQRPGSNGTQTEMGLWSASRSGIQYSQTLVGNDTEQVWLLYTNMNTTTTWQYPCTDKELWMSSPFPAGTTVRNLVAPYETYTLADSLSPYNNISGPPWVGCLAQITMQPFGFLALVEESRWLPPAPMITKFTPGHDFRIHAEPTDANATTVDISFEFNMPMKCPTITSAITFNMSSSGQGGAPTITNAVCSTVNGTAALYGADASQYVWTATLTNFPDGILEIIVTNPQSEAGPTTNVSPSFVVLPGVR